MNAVAARSAHPPRWLWPFLGILLLICFNVAADLLRTPSPGLFGPGSFLHLSFATGTPAGALIDILAYGSIIAIGAIGMTPVIATRGIDLSVGSIMAIAGACAGAASGSALAIPVALGVSLVCGLWNALLVGVLRLQPFVATLVLMVAGRGIAQMITHAQITTFHDATLEFLALGRPAWLPLPMPFLLAASLLLLTLSLARRTPLGLFYESIGNNPLAARLAGVRTVLLSAGAYVFCALCAGLAGVITAGMIRAADPFNAGRSFELAAIFGVVAGGTPLTGGRFSLVGSLAGGLLMQCLVTTMYARDVSADVAPLPQALVILAVCAAGSPALRLRLLPRGGRP